MFTSDPQISSMVISAGEAEILTDFQVLLLCYVNFGFEHMSFLETIRLPYFSTAGDLIPPGNWIRSVSMFCVHDIHREHELYKGLSFQNARLWSQHITGVP